MDKFYALRGRHRGQLEVVYDTIASFIKFVLIISHNAYILM